MKNIIYIKSYFKITFSAFILLFCIHVVAWGQAGQNSTKQSTNYKIHYLNEEKTESVIILLPYNYNSTDSYPILITLHGNGGDAQSMAGVFTAYARLPLIVVIPQGQYPKKAGGYSWFLETNDKSLWANADKKSADYIVHVIKEVQKYYKTDDLFLFGFSQGASLAYMTGFKYPSLFRGVAAIGGSLPTIDLPGSVIKMKDIENADGLKIFVARGKDDSLVPKKVFDYQINFLNKNDYKVESYEYNGPHDFTVDLLQEFYKWFRKYSR